MPCLLRGSMFLHPHLPTGTAVPIRPWQTGIEPPPGSEPQTACFTTASCLPDPPAADAGLVLPLRRSPKLPTGTADLFQYSSHAFISISLSGTLQKAFMNADASLAFVISGML